MRKRYLWDTIKTEFIYWILIAILIIFFIYLKNSGVELKLLLIIGGVTLLLLETWILRIFLLFSGRKISQYSDVIQRISFKDRFFDYFVLPALFIITLLTFIFFNKSLWMGYWVYALSMILLIVMILNIKASLRHIYRINNLTKGVFDFVCLITFFLLLNIVFRLNLALGIDLILIAILSFTMLIAELQLHDRLNFTSILISLASSIFVAFTIGCFIFQSIFITTAIGTVSFYLIIAIWNVRFSGKYKLIDYLFPFIYSVIALILIFNL
jgi:hypothetical protein